MTWRPTTDSNLCQKAHACERCGGMFLEAVARDDRESFLAWVAKAFDAGWTITVSGRGESTR